MQDINRTRCIPISPKQDTKNTIKPVDRNRDQHREHHREHKLNHHRDHKPSSISNSHSGIQSTVNSNKGINNSQNGASSQNNRTVSSPKPATQPETSISSPSAKRKEVIKDREAPTNNVPSRSDQSQFNTPLSRIFAKSSGNSAGQKDGDVEFLTHALVEKKARGILNKITPDNFQRLSKDLVTLSVDVGYAYANNANINFNEEYCQTYSTLLQLIFDKAIDEDRYTTLYALLIQQLLKSDDTFESKSGAQFSIESKKKRDLFLNKLQTDLFKNRYNRYVRTCTGEGVSLRAAALMDHSPQATAEREVKAKRCLLGSMNFIGALFEYNECNGMSSTIIHACVTELLKGASESDIANKINKQKYGQATSDILEKSWILDIECAADLLVKTGAKLEGEHAKATLKVDAYIAKLDKMKTNENLPSRVRFLIHDILDLRKTKWVTETNQANERINRIKGGNQLKSVDEVRKEAITKLYGADPRMGNTPNRLMDELMNGNPKKEKKSRGRGPKDPFSQTGFFRSPSGTRENSRDRSEEKSSFSKSGSFDGRGNSKLANVAGQRNGVMSNGPKGSIGKQTTKVTTPQKPEMESAEDIISEEMKNKSENRRSEHRSESRSDTSRENRTGSRSEIKHQKAIVVQKSVGQNLKYSSERGSEKLSQESHDSRVSEKPKRSRSPAVQPLKPEPVPRRARQQLQTTIKMAGMNEEESKEPQRRDGQGRATWNDKQLTKDSSEDGYEQDNYRESENYRSGENRNGENHRDNYRGKDNYMEKEIYREKPDNSGHHQTQNLPVKKPLLTEEDLKPIPLEEAYTSGRKSSEEYNNRGRNAPSQNPRVGKNGRRDSRQDGFQESVAPIVGARTQPQAPVLVNGYVEPKYQNGPKPVSQVNGHIIGQKPLAQAPKLNGYHSPDERDRKNDRYDRSSESYEAGDRKKSQNTQDSGNSKDANSKDKVKFQGKIRENGHHAQNGYENRNFRENGSGDYQTKDFQAKTSPVKTSQAMPLPNGYSERSSAELKNSARKTVSSFSKDPMSLLNAKPSEKETTATASPTAKTDFSPGYVKETAAGNEPEFLRKRREAKEAAALADYRQKNKEFLSSSDESSENESEGEPEPEVLNTRFRGRRRQLKTNTPIVLKSFQDKVVIRDVEAEKKKEEEEAKKVEQQKVEQKKVNIFAPQYLNEKPKRVTQPPPEPQVIKTKPNLFQPNFGPKKTVAPRPSLPAPSPIKTELSQNMSNSNSMSMFSNVKPEPPKKISNNEILEHMDAVINGKRSIESFIKQNYFKKKNWVTKSVMVKLKQELAVDILTAENRNSGSIRGLKDAITLILKEATEMHKAKYADSDTVTEYTPIECRKLDLIAVLWQKNLFQIDLFIDTIAGNAHWFPLNLQLLGKIYKHNNSKNRLHDEIPVKALYEKMLSERLQKDGRHGRSNFVTALKEYGVFNEWRMRKGILPAASVNRIYLTDSFKECLKYSGSLNRFAGYVDAIKNRSCGVEISVLVMFENAIRETSEEEQHQMKEKNGKTMPYILDKDIAKDLWECTKLRDFLTENQLAALYGCQSLVHEFNHPNRLLMTIFHELYGQLRNFCFFVFANLC